MALIPLESVTRMIKTRIAELNAQVDRQLEKVSDNDVMDCQANFMSVYVLRCRIAELNRLNQELS